MEHIRIKKARKSLIYTLLEVFGKPVCGGSGK
jgi:rRNA maturation protein Nop10